MLLLLLPSCVVGFVILYDADSCWATVDWWIGGLVDWWCCCSVEGERKKGCAASPRKPTLNNSRYVGTDFSIDWDIIFDRLPIHPGIWTNELLVNIFNSQITLLQPISPMLQNR